MKKTVFLLCTLQISLYGNLIETERTIWLPWTVEHTQQWEEIERIDTDTSYFRRNEYFENINELAIRDKNWLALCDYTQMYYNKTVLFPDLGFAIIRKIDQKFIGTIRMKLNNKPGYISFGYALCKEVRNCKFGQEIVKALIKQIDELIGSPIATLKDGIDKNVFVSQWHTEGKKENPDFNSILSFFNPQPHSFQGIMGTVDIKSQASLSILMRSGMQPFEIKYGQYIFNNDTNLFTFDFLLKYPSNQNNVLPTIESLIAKILSRDTISIQKAEDELKNLFNVPTNSTYLQLTRAEKAALQSQAKTVVVKLFSEIGATRNITPAIYYPSYCFIDDI